MATFEGKFRSIVALLPEVSTSQLLSEFVPPREFTFATFASYVPHQEFPSQAAARDLARSFAEGKGIRKLFARSSSDSIGIYLDGGFGVGKTHLLASIWHAFNGTKAFGSFISYTSLIGALGFAEAIKALSRFQLICIDEFELDDPGDTMMMSRLLNELSPKGVRFAATSNTPPNALGEGRFAAADFQREIHGIADKFQMLRIDGEDHRHRPIEVVPKSFSAQELEMWLSSCDQKVTAVDDFEDLLNHLSSIHPSRYGRLFIGLEALALTDCRVLDSQVDALRFVAFVDRAYEAQMKIRGTGIALTEVFSPSYLTGGYRKKYLRAVSRLGAMTA